MTRDALINNPEHWRVRAEETRAVADTIADDEARAAMRRIAADYDRLADRATQRLITRRKET